MVRFDKSCQGVHGATSYFAEHMAKSDYLRESGAVKVRNVSDFPGWSRLDTFKISAKDAPPFTEAKLMQCDDGEGRRVCYFG